MTDEAQHATTKVETVPSDGESERSETSLHAEQLQVAVPCCTQKAVPEKANETARSKLSGAVKRPSADVHHGCAVNRKVNVVVRGETRFGEAYILVDKKHWVGLSEKSCNTCAQIANDLSDEIRPGMSLGKDDAKKRLEAMKLERGKCLELEAVEVS